MMDDNDDAANLVETPEDSPMQKVPGKLNDKEVGGRFIHMAQAMEPMQRSVRHLTLQRKISELGGAATDEPRVVEIDLKDDRLAQQQAQHKRTLIPRKSTLSEQPMIN